MKCHTVYLRMLYVRGFLAEYNRKRRDDILELPSVKSESTRSTFFQGFDEIKGVIDSFSDIAFYFT